jgi:hypothetical protein
LVLVWALGYAIALGITAARIKRSRDVWSCVRMLRGVGTSLLGVGAIVLGLTIISPAPLTELLVPLLIVLSMGFVSILTAASLRRRIKGGAA